MRYLKIYSHSRALLRHGWRVCKLCGGDEGVWVSRFYPSPSLSREVWAKCTCDHGLRDDEAMKLYRRVK